MSIGSKIISATALWALSGASEASPLTLDREFTIPVEQRVAYTFRCPDGLFGLEVGQRRNEPPAIISVRYAGRSISRAASKKINSVLHRLRALESVSPMCLNSGRVKLIIAGLKRDRVPGERLVVGVTIDKEGRVALS